MNTIKKISIIIAISILAILGINSISNAYQNYVEGEDLNVGDYRYINYNQYWNYNNIFCMQRWQHMTGSTYKVVSKVNIDGIIATDHTGKKVEHWANAKFAYILSSTANKHDVVKHAVWNYGYTWMQEVGKNFAGLTSGTFAASSRGDWAALDTESTNYANNITSQINSTIEDKTDKQNVKAVSQTIDNKQYIKVGPFKWNFSGTLTNVSVYDQNSSEITGLIFSKYNGNTQVRTSINALESGKEFYVSVPLDSNVTKIIKLTGSIQIEKKCVNITFLDSVDNSQQNLLVRSPYTRTDNIETSFNYDIQILGNLKVIKVDKRNRTIKLPNVGFYIQNKDTGKYVKRARNGDISYVTTRENATEFVTDINGEILVENLVIGTYVAYETKNPNYGYEIIQDGQNIDVVVDKTAELEAENKQIYVKLSGYVWVDMVAGKQSYRNDLYKEDNDFDTADILLDGIKVRLKDKITGETIKETTTSELGRYTGDRGNNGHGEYLFTDVLTDKLQDYYIEFEYDGLTYTNVIPNIDKNNGSKSAENATVRDNFNKKFSVVEGKSQNTGITRDGNGNVAHNLTYNIDQSQTIATATLINNGLYPITANTNETQYSIKANFTEGQEEIRYINLGLYEREQPDISLAKDLKDINLTINGYNNVYYYGQRFANIDDPSTAQPSENDLNIGVKYRKWDGSYTRAIYKADYLYTSEDKSKELKAYLTYQIKVTNESSNLNVKVNSLVDYFDSNYTITKIGTGLQEGTLNITGEISHEDTNYNNDYKKTVINTSNLEIPKQQSVDIYVQFELNRESIVKILNDKENLDNVVEINSYSVFDESGKVYAGIDRDSNPGNATPGDAKTYEDDTSAAPALKLEVADARELAGKVFEDKAKAQGNYSDSNQLMTGQVRLGDGEYNDGEVGISGVTVTLTENTGSGKQYTATTDENGDFVIKDYIPGDYTLTYTWGDETYTVQNYKGTIYKDKERASNKQWYKTETPRYSDAMDDYNLRTQIDNEIKNITSSTTSSYDKMNSTTPTMGFGIENQDTTTASSGNRYVYRINNIDFGIIERARQELALTKRVNTFKVTLANGQVVADITIDENGNITGTKEHITYQGPSQAYNTNGFVRLELDNELIQGATAEVGYEIKATNNSELEYLSENYYLYGEITGNVVTMTPSGIIDYLDKDWSFDASKNTQWQVKTIDEIKNIVAEVVYNSDESQIEDRIILYTDSLKDKKLKPTESSSVMLNVSKLLSSADEIALDNETEITEINKDGGAIPPVIPGNYVPTNPISMPPEEDTGIAETVIITPNTGDNLNFIVPIMIGIGALVVLAGGVVIIKKRVV